MKSKVKKSSSDEMLRIVHRTLKKCSPFADTITIPNCVTKIFPSAFVDCHKLKQIISDSPYFISKNGCLYTSDTFALVTTICGDVVIPQEVKKLYGPYALCNCSAISFELGGCIFENPYSSKNQYFDNSDFESIILPSVLKTFENEVNKNVAKHEKVKQVSIVTAKAKLQFILKESGIMTNAEIYPSEVFDDELYLRLPMGESGIEVGLSAMEMSEWSQTLPGLLNIVDSDTNLWHAVEYCRQNNLHLSSGQPSKYIVLSEDCYDMTKMTIILNVPCIESIAVSKNVKFEYKDYLRNDFIGFDSINDKIKYITFEGSKQQWNDL